MGLNDRTYWWVTCDEPGCNNEIGDDSDQPSEAKQMAINWGFIKTEDGRWLCPDHAQQERKKTSGQS